MIGMSMLASELVVGRRWVSVERIVECGGLTEARRRELVDPRIERIVDWNREAVAQGMHTQVTLEDADGNHRQVVLCRPNVVVEGGRRIVWTDPLPEDDAIAIALVRGAMMNVDQRRTTMLWIGAVSGDLAYCHVVTDDLHHAEEEMSGKGDGSMRVVIRPRLFRLPGQTKAGDLVAVAGHRANIEAGLHIHSPKLMQIIAHGLTAEQAAAMPSTPRRRSDFASGNFSGSYELDKAEGWSWARSEPSEALVLVHQDGDELRTVALSRTGVAFHNQDDVEIYLEGIAPGIGLWAYRNATMTGYHDYEGGYDQDFDAEVTPADDEFMTRHLGSREDVAREIVAVTNESLDVADLVAAAHQVVESDKVAA